MISYNQSREILKNSRILIGDQIIKSSDCINRVASENIFSKVNNPAGNNAAFDGYAVSSKDTSKLNSFMEARLTRDLMYQCSTSTTGGMYFNENSG